MSIAENLARVQERVQQAANRSGRSIDDITLVAVSKTWPVETIEEAVQTGLQVFGENKVQEILEKVPALPDHLHWHLIGHLQSNKIRKVLPLCEMIHSVDSLKLAQGIDRIAAELNLSPRVLIQVNVASDDAKFGFPVSEIRKCVGELNELENIRIEGLMTVPPFDPDPEQVRSHFTSLRKLRDQLVESTGSPLPHLSMGMSHDFEVAIEEGATLVRVGSSIFGNRDYSTQ